MDRDPNRTALREARRLQRLGSCEEVCVVCGQPATKGVSAQFAQDHGIAKTLIEKHHVVGKERDEGLVVPLCLTHHWLLTVGLLRESIEMKRDQKVQVRVAQCLRALALFLELLTPALREWANLLLGEEE
ncbi:MAG: hypothetical protein ACRDHZ_12060 [Ktedonobacteraceae bacterium]